LQNMHPASLSPRMYSIRHGAHIVSIKRNPFVKSPQKTDFGYDAATANINPEEYFGYFEKLI